MLESERRISICTPSATPSSCGPSFASFAVDGLKAEGIIIVVYVPSIIFLLYRSVYRIDVKKLFERFYFYSCNDRVFIEIIFCNVFNIDSKKSINENENYIVFLIIKISSNLSHYR